MQTARPCISLDKNNDYDVPTLRPVVDMRAYPKSRDTVQNERFSLDHPVVVLVVLAVVLVLEGVPTSDHAFP